MLMDKFWVVTNPRAQSTMGDICFETTPTGYAKFLLGGTHGDNADRVHQLEDECHAFHTSERTAKADAEGRLRIRDVIVNMNREHQASIREGQGQ